MGDVCARVQWKWNSSTDEILTRNKFEKKNQPDNKQFLNKIQILSLFTNFWIGL